MKFEASIRWAAQLKYNDLPAEVIESAKQQIASILSAIILGYRSEEGKKIAKAYGVATDTPDGMPPVSDLLSEPAKMVFMLSAWSMVHDFDDVMLGGHTGHSSVIVPYVLALTNGGDGKDVILAQVAANEVSARFNIACALGETRGQMASYLHLMAASVARSKFEKMPAQAICDAMAFALSNPGKFSLPAFLGSDSKFFCAAGAVRTGWEAVDWVRAGLRSSWEVVDGPQGFFKSHASSARDELFDDFGKQWYTLTNSFKLYPVCGYICSAVDCAIDLINSGDIDTDKIKRVVVDASMFTYGVEKLARPHLDGAESSLATLTFLPSFVVASALVFGEFTVANLSRSRVGDPRLWALMDKVEIRHSRRFTRTALFTGIPTGVMLNRSPWPASMSFLKKFNRTVFSGKDARWNALRDLDLWAGWLLTRRNTTPALNALTKPLGSRVSVFDEGGAMYTAAHSIPRGFSGSCTTAELWDIVGEKYSRALNSNENDVEKRKWGVIEKLEAATHQDLICHNLIGKESICFRNISSP